MATYTFTAQMQTEGSGATVPATVTVQTPEGAPTSPLTFMLNGHAVVVPPDQKPAPSAANNWGWADIGSKVLTEAPLRV